jgi:ubiquinone/menaquinone biosynthesis C-methylase UbiE
MRQFEIHPLAVHINTPFVSIEEAYNDWSGSYDTMANKTRDLEALALREMLAGANPGSVLEFGCGTGKNTAWLMTRTWSLTAVDFSAEMLARARQKVTAPHVQFVQADIQGPWQFVQKPYDLVTCSLVLEHIADLRPVFEKVAAALRSGGQFYMGELHPFKQYTGSKAKFDTADGLYELECYVHHLSDFTGAAQMAGLQVAAIKEWFDEGDRGNGPRVLSILFQKA